jgi:enamine deaminase RidA (YjgF/YER057c/UK114 family)
VAPSVSARPDGAAGSDPAGSDPAGSDPTGARPAGSDPAGARDGRDDIRRLAGEPPSPFEQLFGYSRLVEAGGFVMISGTTSIDQFGVVGGVTPYEQSVEIFAKLLHELRRVGLTPADVVQTRMFVTDISRADEVGRAHGEAFGRVLPAATMVEVSALVDPRMLVEVELVAHRG